MTMAEPENASLNPIIPHLLIPHPSSTTIPLRKGSREALHVVLNGALIAQELHIRTIRQQLSSRPLLNILLAVKRRETPLLGHDDLLAAGELVLRAAESLDGGGAVGVTRAHGQDDLANVDTGNDAVRLAEGAAHSGLQSIGTGAGQHLVDTDDVVGVGADAHVETFLSGNLDEVPIPVLELILDIDDQKHILVGANAGSLKSFGTQLLVLVGDEVDTERELIDTCTLAAKVEDTDLRVGDTTVEARLGVRLEDVLGLDPNRVV